jgi:hypothetical protein
LYMCTTFSLSSDWLLAFSLVPDLLCCKQCCLKHGCEDTQSVCLLPFSHELSTLFWFAFPLRLIIFSLSIDTSFENSLLNLINHLLIVLFVQLVLNCFESLLYSVFYSFDWRIACKDFHPFCKFSLGSGNCFLWCPKLFIWYNHICQCLILLLVYWSPIWEVVSYICIFQDFLYTFL